MSHTDITGDSGDNEDEVEDADRVVDSGDKGAKKQAGFVIAVNIIVDIIIMNNNNKQTNKQKKTQRRC